MTKLTLESDETKLTFELDTEEATFDEVLRGFLGCMFGLGYVPGTEMHCFESYINGMKPLYAKKEVPVDVFDGCIKEQVYGT